MTLNEFLELRILSAQFPLVFRNGAKWDTFNGSCARCRVWFEDGNLRGEVTQPFPDVYVVDALGYCPRCVMLNPLQYRFTADMAMTGLDKTGQWARWEPRRSRWNRFRSWVRGLWA